MAIPADKIFEKHMTAEQRRQADLRATQLVLAYRTLQDLRKTGASDEKQVTNTEPALPEAPNAMSCRSDATV